MSSRLKKLASIRSAPEPHWVGDGFPVRTLFSHQDDAGAISPFLLLDHAGPAAFAPSEERRGVGEHPHRGFETVTIVYQGGVEHRDSAGNHGRIGPGDVQWMTAAAGVVHEEWHDRAFTRQGGILHMVQLWVNLPGREKMTPPRYQEIPSRQIPVVAIDDVGRVRVIAGTSLGARGPARTVTPLSVLDLSLKAGARLELPLPEGHTTMVAVLQGRALLDGVEEAGAAELASFAREGERIAIETREETTLLVLSGEPIDEPVVGYGPFVMNTKEEIHQAIADYQSGKMGRSSA